METIDDILQSKAAELARRGFNAEDLTNGMIATGIAVGIGVAGRVRIAEVLRDQARELAGVAAAADAAGGAPPKLRVLNDEIAEEFAQLEQELRRGHDSYDVCGAFIGAAIDRATASRGARFTAKWLWKLSEFVAAHPLARVTPAGSA